MSNKFELHEERLATTDELGHRVFLHPEEVKGKWRSRRTFFYWFLIFVFLVLPWIYSQGKQLVLFDIAKREFYLFGKLFYAHELPLLVLIIAAFIFMAAFITSVWGRAWCGWACPQTVFIDTLYRKIELMIEGNARKRMQLDLAPMSFSKLSKRTLKWGLYLLVSLHISHSFLGYFVGTRHLLNISLSSPFENWGIFTAMMVITAIILFDFGWFREQFCIIACPYGRIQSVAMDEKSMVVLYDANRGEPRRGISTNDTPTGDCINCYACVKSCPTGIDIRRGTQLECIACTNCIDACDDIMMKVKKPIGLIRYGREVELNQKKFKLGFRNLLYLTLSVGAMITFLSLVYFNLDYRVELVRAKNVFTKTKTGNEEYILNQYQLKIDSKKDIQSTLFFYLTPEDQQEVEIVIRQNPIQVEPGRKAHNIFFKFKEDILVNGKGKTWLEVKDEKNKVIYSKEVSLVGPFN
jgi:cytochrome c oxidase accessory protein FixG